MVKILIFAPFVGILAPNFVFLEEDLSARRKLSEKLKFRGRHRLPPGMTPLTSGVL